MGPIPIFCGPMVSWITYDIFCNIFCCVHLFFVKVGTWPNFCMGHLEMQSELVLFYSFYSYMRNNIKKAKISDLKTMPNKTEFFWSCSSCISKFISLIQVLPWYYRHAQNHFGFLWYVEVMLFWISPSFTTKILFVTVLDDNPITYSKLVRVHLHNFKHSQCFFCVSETFSWPLLLLTSNNSVRSVITSIRL